MEEDKIIRAANQTVSHNTEPVHVSASYIKSAEIHAC